jgi:hypothetical protein
MKKLFVNLTNHPLNVWSDEQKNAVEGTIVDVPFPKIDPKATIEEIQELAYKHFNEINNIADNLSIDDVKDITVMVQGEFTFVHNFVNICKDGYIKCVAATSERNTIDNPDGSKTVSFNFVQFREY